jgi:hypothetical protein
METSYFEKLVRQYFQALIKNECLYNHRPNWLRYKTGYNLELDLYFPDLKFAVEVNGKQHYLLQKSIDKDLFKSDRCAKKGIYLLIVTHPSQLLRKNFLIKIQEATGLTITTALLGYSLKHQMTHYKPKKMQFMRGLTMKARLEICKKIQDEEVEFNRRKLQRLDSI